MQFEQFVEAYPRLARKSAVIEKGSIFETLETVSSQFGETLHNYLTDNDPTTLNKEESTEVILDYKKWGMTVMPDLYEAVGRIENEEASRNMTRGNFHTLNLGMANMWRPIFESGWHNQAARIEAINSAQDLLAFHGMAHYAERERLANKASSNTHTTFFSPGYQSYRGWFNGLVNEIDTAIVLLEAIKDHPDVTVVPGPPQFEDSGRQTNADFLVIDTTKREAIGVQTKATVSSEQHDAYDPNYIVMIDGAIDLGNSMAKRTMRNHSYKAIISWPGLISVHRMRMLPVHGPRLEAVKSMFGSEQRVVQQKMLARQALTGAAHSNFRSATRHVSERVFYALYNTETLDFVVSEQQIN